MSPVRLLASIAGFAAVCGPAFAEPSAGRALAESRPLGFSAANAGREKTLEKAFDAKIDPADLRRWLELMSSEPNHVGTAKDKANADFMLEQFRAWGWDAHIETFYCLYPTPVSHALELVAPVHYSAQLTEPPVPGDRTSVQVANELPAYNVYGADGDVTAGLVYANYGMPEDYDELARLGISVKGRIVLARYGVGWRGLKPKLAYEHGAVGCIIYSDPHEDGFFRGDAYPEGPWKGPHGLQRGSVMDMPVHPGDPLTPGVGATKDAKRLTIAEATTVLKIMVMPIAYAEAQHLLAALGGPVSPESWHGALPLTYRVGPGSAKVHMRIKSDWSLKPVYDVIATLRGSEFPDEWVVRGNHHDGWTFGAYDPLSANVSMMAEARAIGDLARAGWRPKRTLVYCGWDGEEPGMLGSTEWVEEHAAELRQKTVLYLNSDCYGRGWLNIGGSQELAHFVNQAVDGVRDPETGASLGERWRAARLVEAYGKGGEDMPPLRGDHPLKALGGGSDFAAFLQYLGVPTLDTQVWGEFHSGGIYHSAYDSFDYFVRYVDPGFVYGVAQAKANGRMVLRMADAEVLPMRFGDFAGAVGVYLEQVRHLAEKMRKDTDLLNHLVGQGAFRLAADPQEQYVPPEAKAEVPALPFGPLDVALARLKRSAESCDRAYAAAAARDFRLAPDRIVRVDGLLQGLEQTLLDPEGLPGRPWNRHLIYASGLLTGYDTKTLPAVREAIEGRRWDEANRYIVRTAQALDRFSRRLDEVTAALRP